MERELLGYVIGENFCNTELLINNGKIYKTKESATRYINKHNLTECYIREYYLYTPENNAINAGKIGYILANIKP